MTHDRTDRGASLGLALVIGAIAVAAAAWMSSFEPLDHGYGRYTTIAEAMVRTGDYVVPHLSGSVYVDKPPLFCWLVAAPIAMLGRVPEWVGHLPNATSYEFADQARGERLDPVFACFVTGSLVLFFLAERAAAAGRRGAWTFVACGALLGLATMTKGPVGPALFVAAALPYAILTRSQRSASIWPGVGIVLVVLLAVSLPWPIAFVRRLGLDAATSIVQGTEFGTRHEAWHHYLVQLPLSLAPWTLLLPAAIAWLFVRRAWRSQPWLLFAACWLVGPMLVLQASPVRNTRYLLPVLPAAAVLLGAMIVEADAAAGRRWSAWLDVALRATLILLPVAVVVGTAVLVWRKEEFVIPAAAAVVIVPWAVVALRARRRETGATLTFVSAAGMILLSNAAIDVLRARDYARRDSRARAEAALSAVPAGADVCALDIDRPEQWVLPLILRREVAEVDDRDALRARCAGRDAGVWTVTRADEAARLASDDSFTVVPHGAFELRSSDLVLLEVRSGS